MAHVIRNSSRLIMLATLVILMAVGGGCKSKKKAREAAAAAERARIEQESALKRQQEEEEARRRANEEEEAARRAAEANKANPQAKLEQYFNAISNSGNAASANSSINEALTLFASDQTPVLIVIHESGGQKDYDRPTTIKDYLNYLKDQKKQADKIGNLQFDNSGKITEVELVKE